MLKSLFYHNFLPLLLVLLHGRVFAHFPPNCSIVIQENLARGYLIVLPYVNKMVGNLQQFNLQVTNRNPYFNVVSDLPGARMTTSGQQHQNPWHIWYPKDPSPITSPWYLVTLQRIDRERLCQTEPGCDCRLGNSYPNRLGTGPDCVLPLRLVAIPSKKVGLPLVIDLTICIADENDNSPSFRFSSSAPRFGASPVVSVHFKEDAQIGESTRIPAGYDSDAYPEHTVSSYSLNCPEKDVPFSLVYDISTPERLDLQVDKPLKFDGQWPLHCTVTAFDGKHSGSMQLKIHLDDVNNHKPVWEPPSILNSAITLINETSDEWALEISESVPPFTVLLQLKASDEDPVYGRLTYSMEGGKEGGLLFDIDSKTGEVRLVSKQDYEIIGNGAVTVPLLVADNGGLSIPGKLIFYLKDVNDNRPLIRFSGGEKHAEIVENSQSNVYIDYITVSDADSGVYGQVECYLKPGVISDHFQLTRIEDNLWAFQAAKPIDRESLASTTATTTITTSTQHNRLYAPGTRVGITVACNDNPGALKEYQLSAESTIQVTIVDVNDNPPQFIGLEKSTENAVSIIDVAISEGVPPGTPVVRIAAEDPDVGDTLTYALLPFGNKKLSIDPVSGLVTTQGVFDREDVPILTGFKVFVFDGGDANHSVSADLRVTILDQNDNSPVFHSQTVLTVPEDKPVDSLLHVINVTDADAGENGTVTLFFTQHQQPANPFTLHPDGRLFLTRPLDRERREHYELTIIAADKGIPALSSTFTLLVQVEDVNDSPPQFELPVGSFLKTVSCTQSYVALDIAATDADSLPKNTVINYRILNVKGPIGDSAGQKGSTEKDNSPFYIEPDTGALLFHGQNSEMPTSIDPCDRTGVYRLTIMAFDPHRPELNSNATVTLHITRPHVMEDAPMIETATAETGNASIGLSNHFLQSADPPAANQYVHGASDVNGGEEVSIRHADGNIHSGSGSIEEESASSRSNRMTFLGLFLLITVFIGLTLLLVILIYLIKRRITVDESSAAVGPGVARGEVHAPPPGQYLSEMTLKKKDFLADAYLPPTTVYGTVRSALNAEPIEQNYSSDKRALIYLCIGEVASGYTNQLIAAVQRAEISRETGQVKSQKVLHHS
ncbi:Protocadherin [Echinococcus granulosus]|uniref:Protocadherin n=1 Tax=Echinococcus granulosus TaxID=6210 RepID=W6USB6_ECHGR|nr:Protocadherin [Echinococcus granulosus]EUB61257.1 Protocadherin [Echinococcus granulosus]